MRWANPKVCGRCHRDDRKQRDGFQFPIVDPAKEKERENRTVKKFEKGWMSWRKNTNTHTHRESEGNANKLVYVKFIHKCGRAHEQLAGNWIWISIWICCAPNENCSECVSVSFHIHKNVWYAKRLHSILDKANYYNTRRWGCNAWDVPWGAGLSGNHLGQQAGHEIAEFCHQ